MAELYEVLLLDGEKTWHAGWLVDDAGISARGPNEFLVIESQVHDASGETVVVARSTLLSRGTART